MTKISPSKTYKTIGASSHAQHDRQIHDYYATEPKAVRLFLEQEEFSGSIWECACGEGHLSKEMLTLGYDVYSTDLIDRGYGDGIFDFLSLANKDKIQRNIITNPPYKYANHFIVKAMSLMEEGYKLAFLLPIRYLEGKSRKDIFKKYPPKVVYISSSRLVCAINGEFIDENGKEKGSAMAYAWFVWEKGYSGSTIIKWFN
jgi:hypothetical protein